MYRPIRFVPDDTKIPFMRYSRAGFIGAMVAVLASIALFVAIGLNYGIDFEGGTLVEIRTEQPADLNELRSRLSGLGLGDFELQEFGQPTDVLIRIKTAAGGEEVQQQQIAEVRQALGEDIDYRRIEVVGPKVSGELTRDGIIAVLLALAAVLIYIWFRFEWQFSVGTIISLVHDVVVTIGVLTILRYEFNLASIAALLTIVGYSLNDTVVVFDRIRENLRKYKQMPLSDLIDLSLNQTLPRTLMTSVSTLIALFSLYFFGGEVLRSFTFTMIFGIFIGTFSSIFISA
ncbi:MAG: protein translocase subunit SecF, partial [Hyphomicrobiales bacterium]